MRQNQRGLLKFVYDICHNEGLATARNTQERLLVFFGEVLD
jgi:hypothetical protein